MAYQALYRKYRPSSFDEVVGQEHIIQTLKNAVYQNRIAHAYLFCGPRGTGKTTIAKIFAKILNCEDERNKPCEVCENCKMVKNGNHPDIIEIDAASNNGVDEVRNLIDKVKYAPLQGKYKVYIIDEVHMMSTGAFNALLKTIEEPPEHVIFIFATTEPNKVIPTIISRCQRFDFSKVSQKDIEKRLNIVCKEENIQIEPEAISLIAQLADGGMRDSLSILDQCIAYSITNIKVDDVRQIYGVLNAEDIGVLYSYLIKKDITQLIQSLQRYSDMGIDLQRLTKDFISIMKESIILDYSESSTLVTDYHKEIIHKYISNSPTQLKLTLLEKLMDTYSKYVYASNVLDYLETCFLSVLAESYEFKKVSDYNSNDSDENMNKTSDFIKETAIVQENNSTNEQLSLNDDIVPETVEIEIVEQISDVSRETLEEEKIEDSKIILNDEYILQLLVGANKQEKAKDINKLSDLLLYCSDINYAKYANSLRNMNIFASSYNYMIVVCDSELESKNINELQVKEGYEQFTKVLLGQSKKVFAIDKKQSENAVAQFREHMMNKTLPEAAEVIIVEKNSVSPENQLETDLKNLFPTLEINND